MLIFLFFLMSLKLEPQTEKTIKKPPAARAISGQTGYPDGIRGAKAPLP
jgi:hypothetical protein